MKIYRPQMKGATESDLVPASVPYVDAEGRRWSEFFNTTDNETINNKNLIAILQKPGKVLFKQGDTEAVVTVSG